MVLQRTASWKGPMDGVGGTIKNRVYRDMMSDKCVIKSAKEFSNYANKVVNGITSLYLPEADLLTEPDDIEEAPKIPETLSIHMLVRNLNKDSICSIQFFNLAADIEPLFTQCYGMDGGPAVCGMNYYHYRLTPIKPVLFAKAITRVKLNGFSATSVSNGSTKVVSLNNLMLDI